jgi:hypothetical protein
MIYWQAVIGKMVEFMSTKLAAKWIDLRLDDKKRACRAFVKLYFAMEQLETITSELLKCLEEIEKGRDAYIRGGPLFDISKMVDTNSRMFLDGVSDLGQVLELYDPVLSAELVQLSVYKGSFLMTASETFNVGMDEIDNTVSLTYTKPAEKFLRIDFEETYEWLERREHLYDVSDVFEWPQNFIVRFFIEEGDLETTTVRIDNKHDVMKFYDTLKQHSAVLSNGRERLRSLIIQKFQIEDILYISKRLR